MPKKKRAPELEEYFREAIQRHQHRLHYEPIAKRIKAQVQRLKQSDNLADELYQMAVLTEMKELHPTHFCLVNGCLCRDVSKRLCKSHYWERIYKRRDEEL